MTIRSSIYLSGNKFKLWDKIKPYLQEGKRKYLNEPFLGSGTIALNALNEGFFEKCSGNDLSWWLVDFHKSMKKHSFIKDVVFENAMYQSTKEDYERLKDDYNKDLSQTAKLYNLMLRGTNNWVRFSGKEGNQKHNMSYGKRNRLDIPRMEQHHKLCQDLEVSTGSFSVYLNRLLSSSEDLSEHTVYIDPPYTGTVATYSENGGWTTMEDNILLDLVLKLHDKGARIVMSNIFFNKGYTAHYLIDWCELHSDKFEVHHLDRDYKNSSRFTYTGKKTDEVLIVSK